MRSYLVTLEGSWVGYVAVTDIDGETRTFAGLNFASDVLEAMTDAHADSGNADLYGRVSLLGELVDVFGAEDSAGELVCVLGKYAVAYDSTGGI